MSGLFVYPVKSCRGLPLDEAPLARRGIVHDREFAVVDTAGTVVTQRQRPLMALVAPAIEGSELIVSAPGCAPLRVTPTDDGVRRDVRVWGDACTAVDQGDTAAQWFSGFLGLACRLVRMADDHVRPVDLEHLPGHEVGFADAYPLLLVTEESLADLNSRMSTPLPIDRFRPNIVVRGAQAYADDGWHGIRIGDLEMRVAKPCERCTVTTTDQQTGTRGDEPLRTLATYRRETTGGVVFGQNLAHLASGTVRIGDRVEVVS